MVGIYWPPWSLQILYKRKTRHQTGSVSLGPQIPSWAPRRLAPGSAVVIDKVIAAGLLGHWRRGFGNLDVLQVQEPQLHLHAQQRVQVALRQLAGHVFPQKGTEAVDPDAVLAGEQVAKRHTVAPGQQEALPRSLFWEASHQAPLGLSTGTSDLG